MNRRLKQIAFHDSPIGSTGAGIFLDNRRVQFSELLPSDLINEKYAENFEGSENGNVAVSSQVAFAALLIKKELNLSDEETVTMIRENPHCQHFLGFPEFTDSSTSYDSKMVAFRHRFSASVLAEINETIIQGQVMDNDSFFSSNDDTSSNGGTLILVAICTPASILFTTYASVLNDVREKSEYLIDVLYALNGGGTKPRTYRRVGRKSYLTLVRNKRPSFRLIRRTLCSRLPFLRRYLGHLELNWVMARPSGVSASVIQLITIVMNLKKSLRVFLLTFFTCGNEVLFGRLTQNSVLASSPQIALSRRQKSTGRGMSQAS